MRARNIWYTRNRSYDIAIGLKTIAYNLMVVPSMELGEKPGERMRIVAC
ncbi:hypothetical protein Thermo_01415 [Thermoplasmatales archaeon]|nr:hypothetical protein Thermo_01415 [Thermoplasmatales archaeon]